jgi:cytochrome c peroxidase
VGASKSFSTANKGHWRPHRRWVALTACTAIAVVFPRFSVGDENPLLGLPPVSIPADNPQTPQKIALGKKLFLDARFSVDGKVSCASCHEPERAFTDGRVVAKGVMDQVGARNTPTIMNAAYNTSQFWDGRRASLEEQAADPFVNPSEHGLTNHDAILRVVRSDKFYVETFQTVYAIQAADIRMEHIVKSLASFERTLVAGNSPFDRYFYRGEKGALSDSAQRGHAIFHERARCASCHTIGPQSALFTDNQFHALGIGYEAIALKLATLTKKLTHSSRREIDALIIREPDVSALGRFAVSLKPGDIGHFKTPSLRDVALTPPYMHDGSVATLAEAIELELYNRGTVDSRPPILSPRDKEDLAEFLRALTSSDVLPIGTQHSFRPAANLDQQNR